MQALKFFANQKSYFDKLVDISIVSLTKDGGSDNGFSLSSAIVNFVLQKGGIQHARVMYKRYMLLDNKLVIFLLKELFTFIINLHLKLRVHNMQLAYSFSSLSLCI